MIIANSDKAFLHVSDTSLSTLQILILWQPFEGAAAAKYCYYSHFTDEETEAQGGEAAFPKSYS